MTNNITIGYIRVSTEEQARDGYSLQAQRLFIEQYANENKLSSLTIFEDNGYSAKNENRPQYKRLLDLITNNKIKNIIIHKIDRLSRNITDFNNFVNLCSINNINLLSITDSINFNSAVGRGTSNIMISIAQMEREQISERTKAGYVAMIENGEYPFGGRLPLGISKTTDKKLYYNKDIEIVREIIHLHLHEKVPFKELEKQMTNKYKHKDLVFKKSSIERMIKNELYQGIVNYNGKEYKFLDSILTKNEIELINNKQEHYKYMKTTKYYKYHHKLFYNNQKMYPSTTTKKLKTTNKIQKTTYYVSKCRKIMINEAKLDKLLNNALSTHNASNNDINKQKISNLKQLYVMEDITLDEYKDMKKDLESKNFLNLNDIDKLNINNNLNITIHFTNGQIKRFQYIKKTP